MCWLHSSQIGAKKFAAAVAVPDGSVSRLSRLVRAPTMKKVAPTPLVGPGPVTVMRQSWQSVTFLHWPCSPAAVQSLLPQGLEVEAREGQAWVSIVLLRMHIQAPVGPPVDLLPTFPETNVRTYVVGPNGEAGIWFFSLDAASAVAVAAARAFYNLPYCWSRMHIAASDGTFRYTSARQVPGPASSGHDIRVRPRDPIAPGEVREIDHFLTARFVLWARYGPFLVRTPASHAPWPLRHAQVGYLREDLVEAAGLPKPQGPPLVHFSAGVDVSIGAPRFYNRRK